MTANEVYVDMLSDLGISDDHASPRKMLTREIVGYKSEVDMTSPIVTVPGRDLDYQFMAAEAHWILSGDRRLNHPALTKNLLKYSDDARTMRGAYGPPFIQQAEYVVDILRKDRDSRQAVMTLWERNPRPGKDIPCTVAMQFLIRDDMIHTNVFMRSSDAWLGWPYDVFTFTMMTHTIRMGVNVKKIKMGTLTIFAGSQHLYERHLEKVGKILSGKLNLDNLIIHTHRFISQDHLMECLGDIASCHKPIGRMKFLLCQ